LAAGTQKTGKAIEIQSQVADSHIKPHIGIWHWIPNIRQHHHMHVGAQQAMMPDADRLVSSSS